MAVPMGETMASLRVRPTTHPLGAAVFFGWIQGFYLSAREPSKLMILGAALIVLAILLRKRIPAGENEAHLEFPQGSPS